MANFLHHGPCKKCGSRDNRGHYDDGSEYCFGCKDYKPPTKRSEGKVRKPVMDIRESVVSDIPEPNLSWLRQYLDDDKIKEFFVYSPDLGRHVYIDYSQDDEGDKLYWEARKVADNKGIFQKVISAGTKPYKIWGKWKETGVVVIVEDIVSAIKVSDYAGVLCLHGSIIPHSLYSTLGGMAGIKRIVIWMDRDKLSQADIYLRKFQAFGKNASLVMTHKDPKAYSGEEIQEILKDAV